jgi:response regulator RpfG family c-di-GMP phosphodiesterase
MLDLGCDDFVSKPIQEHIIIDKIAEHLGLVYTYAKSTSQDAEFNQKSSDRQQAINQDLNALNQEWLSKLDLAARAADEEEIFQLLTQVQDAHPAIASVIQDFVNDFQLDQIINIIEPFINKNH